MNQIDTLNTIKKYILKNGTKPDKHYSDMIADDSDIRTSWDNGYAWAFYEMGNDLMKMLEDIDDTATNQRRV